MRVPTPFGSAPRDPGDVLIYPVASKDRETFRVPLLGPIPPMLRPRSAAQILPFSPTATGSATTTSTELSATC